MKIKLSAQLKHLLTKELFCHQALVREFFTGILPLNQFLKIKIRLMYFLTELLGWYTAVFLVLNMILSKPQIANMGVGGRQVTPHHCKISSCKDCV